MIKTLTLCIAISFFSFMGLQAAVVSSTRAQSIALNFFRITFPNQLGHGTLSASLKYTQTEPDSSVDFYVFDINPMNGFVIVSANDAVKPVLGYSNEAYFKLRALHKNKKRLLFQSYFHSLRKK